MLRPAKPSMAGSSVTEAVMVTSTNSEAVNANPASAGWPTRRMPSIATHDGEAGEHDGASGRRDRGQRSRVVGLGPRRGCCGTG